MSATATPSNAHIVRLYVIVAMLAVFFVLWTNIATHPWSAPSAAPTAVVTTQSGGSPAGRLISARPVTQTTSSGVVVTQASNPGANRPAARLAATQQPVTVTRSS